MMGFREERKAIAFETVDQPDLPQWLSAIELLREDTAGQDPKLVLASRRRQRGEPNVVPQVEVRVVDPLRPALPKRDMCELLPVARHEVKTPLDALDELVVV